MKIALDVDGVLADVMESWLSYNNKLRPLIKKEEITKWDFWRHHNINQFDFYRELSYCWRNWSSIPPTETNLSETIDKLAKFGQIDIVTARERSTDNFVKKWLSHFNITFDNYVSVIDGPMKADLDYDVFIDDSPLNVKNFIKNGKNVLLYRQPWNMDIQDMEIQRINSLVEGVDYLSSI